MDSRDYFVGSFPFKVMVGLGLICLAEAVCIAVGSAWRWLA